MPTLSTNQLMKIASVGGVFVIGNALLMRFLAQRRLQQSPYYVQGKDIVMGNKALLEFMGEPLGFGSVDLGDTSKNFSNSTLAKFEIPLKGSKEEGTLHLSSTRRVNDIVFRDDTNNEKSYSGWVMQSLEVTIKDKPNHKLVLVKDSDL